MTRLFGTDGIRGRWGRWPMLPEVAGALGRALVARFGPRVGVVRDTRGSGPALTAALAGGAGPATRDFGVLPTPALSVLLAADLADVGVAVTASHNPAADNGLKVLGPGGTKLHPATEAALEAEVLACLDEVPPQPGVPQDHRGVGFETYVVALRQALPAGPWLAGHRIALDAAHGAAFRTAPALLEALGAEVVARGVRPTGDNINDGCGALHPEALAAVVVAEGCEAGLALDGDADRCVLVDGGGRVVDGDALLLLLARPPGLVGTVMCNQALELALAERGVDFARVGVGDREVALELERRGWPVGGEPSGHVLLGDGLPTGDGLLTGLRALAGGLDLAQRLGGYVPHPQAVATVVVDRKPPLSELPVLQAALAGLTGRAVVRYSGTEPKLRLLVEAGELGVAEAELSALLEAVECSGLPAG